MEWHELFMFENCKICINYTPIAETIDRLSSVDYCCALCAVQSPINLDFQSIFRTWIFLRSAMLIAFVCTLCVCNAMAYKIIASGPIRTMHASHQMKLQTFCQEKWKSTVSRIWSGSRWRRWSWCCGLFGQMHTDGAPFSLFFWNF